MKQGWIYILTNRRNAKKYGLKMIIWYEHFDNLHDARRREVQMKEWKRAWKIELIEATNPEWRDLYPDLSR